MGSKQKPFEADAVVPEKGIYRVLHTAHRLPLGEKKAAM